MDSICSIELLINYFFLFEITFNINILSEHLMIFKLRYIMSNTFSFVVLHDLEVYDGPYHTNFDELTPEIIKILFQQYSYSDNNDPTYFFEKNVRVRIIFSDVVHYMLSQN